ncbi:signal transduction histidine kinase [Curtobacterium sp. PhB172]|uniref:sensor histidine kinase n=1 Tax=unclassified Curtobacterium TaxID=257496 RepID=UPI000F9B968C|nr:MULTISPECIES: sensor histidine kinase [unclassified Curtobacterium]ROQ18269.1 signal transduction histidine kinase [Curtobacterium sp. PhB171]ROQ30229.1 signal transduction histidine kinase [Curtobacterium sp. PhB170]ROS32435.1 signal transduction histidine kinase [Curtobacterium sp. PhB131]ROS58730.1 signal transduction histidine kinase [Curtobacterium sp. PhB172]ROS63615.1 signal transduction histidine kinase [Curtobacterium sp. PhB141]
MGTTTEWSRLPVGRREHRQDAVLALVLAAGLAVTTVLYGSAGTYGDDQAAWWVSALMIVANAVPIAFRRRFPMSAAVVSALAFAATQLLHVPEVFLVNFTLFISLYSVGAWCADRVRAEVVRWVVIGGMFAWLFLAISFGWAVPNALPNDEGALIPPYIAYSLLNIVINVIYFGAAWYAGNRAWASAVARHQLDERTAELAAERERSAAQAVTIERVRIARELHDVVAHHVSLMGVQAGAARRVIDRDPAQATASLGVVEESARTAVEELRRMLGTLRSADEPGTGDRGVGDAPSTVGIARIVELAESARVAGHPTDFVVVGDERPVPPTVAAVAYRIVQEAVTNVLKHAGPTARADVRLRYLDDGVEVEVTDDGHGDRAARSPSGSGLGHIGMRERVAAVDGRIEIGPRARGGYLVRAWLPTT